MLLGLAERRLGIADRLAAEITDRRDPKRVVHALSDILRAIACGYEDARSEARRVGKALRRVLRLMREHDLLAPGRVGSPRGPRSHDGTIVPDTIDTMWGTDLTATFTGEGPAAVFIAVDHCDAVGIGGATPRDCRQACCGDHRPARPETGCARAFRHSAGHCLRLRRCLRARVCATDLVAPSASPDA